MSSTGISTTTAAVADAPAKLEFILVPGACHSPSCFAPTTALLEAAGYVVHGISLASVGGPPLSTYLSPSSPSPANHGKILHLFYITAFILPAPSSLMSASNDTPAPWYIISGDGTQVEVENPREIFYNDVEPALATQLMASLKPHAYRVLFSETTVEPWRVLGCTYVMCTLFILPPRNRQADAALDESRE
ncbi:hypothetical protein LOCC1_G007835 [Lachnellula occidentalis]|uniref:Uncharacterized protein n=1 Tax=Lachnellula occidentalis TaxID=215460 RepID=A0A8H8U9H8_9HELO|nr:hypothetical protein LOCC1_G007835 [Lachnellula occidentalis]